MSDTLAAEHLERIADFVRARCGIALDSSKDYLIEGRWRDLLREQGCSDYLRLCERVQVDSRLADRLIDAISTKETSFFRDATPFTMLQTYLLPQMLAARSGGTVKIWSAACATGQEVYSLAMIVVELLGPSRRVEILGTDLSETALNQAREGSYSTLEADRGLTVDRRSRHFEAIDSNWKASTELRSLVTFRRVNLLNMPTDLGPFDIILCRNIAAYFDEANRQRLYDAVALRLLPEGALIVGSTESLVGVRHSLERCDAGGSVHFRRRA
jgi:chemotaxis protein methyltransferase CheR